MKIVVNRCHGGFGLSAPATARLCELKDVPCFFFTGYPDPMVSTPPEKIKRGTFYHAYSTEIPVDGHYIHLPERDDPDLVRVVEEMGPEADNFPYAQLEIVEVPDDVEWEIEEYDGAEWVSEKHRTW